MNPAIKKLWLNALRSGDYDQGCNALHPNHDQFCCLGVLTDIYLKRHNRQWLTRPDDKVRYAPDKNDRPLGGALLPSYVTDWADLDYFDPIVDYKGEKMRLSIMNDDGYNFDEIANAIEQSL